MGVRIVMAPQVSHRPMLVIHIPIDMNIAVYPDRAIVAEL